MAEFSFQTFADLAGDICTYFSTLYEVLMTKTVFDLPIITVLLGGGLVAYITVAIIGWVVP